MLINADGQMKVVFHGFSVIPPGSERPSRNMLTLRRSLVPSWTRQSTCQSVIEQDAEAQPAGDAAPVVCVCVCERFTEQVDPCQLVTATSARMCVCVCEG